MITEFSIKETILITAYTGLQAPFLLLDLLAFLMTLFLSSSLRFVRIMVARRSVVSRRVQ